MTKLKALEEEGREKIQEMEQNQQAERAIMKMESDSMLEAKEAECGWFLGLERGREGQIEGFWGEGELRILGGRGIEGGGEKGKGANWGFLGGRGIEGFGRGGRGQIGGLWGEGKRGN